MIHNINMIKNPNFKYTQKKIFFITNTNFRMAFYEKKLPEWQNTLNFY